MKSLWLGYIISLVCILLLAVSAYWFFYPEQLRKFIFASPLPAAFSLLKNNQVTSLTLWQPKQAVLGDATTALPISGTSVISYDLTTDRILFEKDATKKMPMASLTKVMTAVVSLEHSKSDNQYVVHGADLVGEDSMGLDSGEILSLKELLYGLILHSGNDAAEVLASNYPGGRKAFITAMNDKAASLGLTDTHFDNPTGLEGDGVQDTTAHDLLVITRYALVHFSLFADVAATVDTTIQKTSTHKEYYIENETNLLTTYPGVKGVKTGYTPEAGYCLITYLDYGDHHIIAVLLGSEDRRADMKKILDYSLQQLGIDPPEQE